MKKILLLSFWVLSIFFITGCSSVNTTINEKISLQQETSWLNQEIKKLKKENNNLPEKSDLSNNIDSENISIFKNDGILFTLVDFTDAFPHNSDTWDISNYVWYKYTKYSGFTVRVIKKNDLLIPEKSLSTIFKSKSIDTIKTNILPVEPFIPYNILQEYLELDNDIINNVKDSKVIISFNEQWQITPTLNIFIETDDYIIWIYSSSLWMNRDRIKKAIEDWRILTQKEWLLPKNYVKYYKVFLDTNKYYSNLIKNTIESWIKIFEINDKI